MRPRRTMGGEAAVGALLLSAAALSAQAAPASPEPFTPDTVFVLEGGPRVIHLPAPGSPLVTLHASVAFTEGPTEGGAGRLLAELGQKRARSFAGPVSARIEGTRTPMGLSYTVSGSVRDLDYLAYLLRVALSDPTPGSIEFRRARNSLIEEVRRSRETASRTVARELRERVFEGATPLDGTLGSLQLLTGRTLRDVWLRSHGAADIDLVVVGDLPPELLLLAAQGMGKPDGSSGSVPTASAPSARTGAPEVLRRWFGEARLLPDARDPRGAVAALLVAEHMRDVSNGFESHVELWQLGDRRALAVMGAAYSSQASTMRSRVGSATTGAADALTPARLERAVSRVRREALFEARTPWGRAAMAGRHTALGGSPDAATGWVAALDAITLGNMRDFLTDLAARRPARTEVTP